MFRPESASLQCTYGFESSQHSHDAVVFSRVGDGVDMRAGANRRRCRIGTRPASEGVADRILSNREPGFLTTRRQPCSRLEIGGSKNNSGDGGSFRIGNCSERFDLREQPRLD